MFDHKEGKKISQCTPLELSISISSSFLIASKSFLSLSVFAFPYSQHAAAMIEEGCAESHAAGLCILQCGGNSPASFSIPTS